jgi:uncharacterized phiE125 gp8 family phage protein
MTQNLTLVNAPGPAVTLADAKAFLHVWHDDDDAVITHLIAAATDKLDGADGVLGRCLAEQTWRLSLDCFPSGVIKLPLPPLKAVNSIKYFDRNGDEQTLSAADYKVSGAGVVAPVGAWPATWEFPGAVSVEFEAGSTEVPASLKQIIFSLVFFWYENRGAGTQPTGSVAETPYGFDDAIAQWKVPYVG